MSKLAGFIMERIKVLAIASVIALILILFFGVPGCISMDPDRFQDLAVRNLIERGVLEPTDAEIRAERERLNKLSEKLVMDELEDSLSNLKVYLEKAIDEPAYFAEHQEEIDVAQSILNATLLFAAVRGGDPERVTEIREEMDLYFRILTASTPDTLIPELEPIE